MTREDVYQLLSNVAEDVPVAYRMFLDTPESRAPDPPFVCYFYPGSDDLFADDENYQGIAELAVELYTDNKDFVLEADFEKALRAAGLAWNKEETYLDGERMYMTTWTTQVVLDENRPSDAESGG